uniref:AAA+ ATPase domain-containing protein n=1 Tax=Caloglossa monosticha TaxID=76906 RepID=A0A1Z1M586_9FLOR|nr:hypothetical protein [Caloglossa monosticha]ARW61070.1 hypothetical protein [Caloglossa monosticha]
MLIADDLDKLLKILPEFVRLPLEKHVNLKYLIEVVMDLGRKPEARFPDGPEYLSKMLISWNDLDFCIKKIGNFSSDNRSGIESTLHRISSIKNRNGNIIGLTCRVGRSVFGTISVVRDLLQCGKSLLLLGKPGVGKTTAIREISRILADEMQKRVVIIDTSNEIAGDGDIPHPAIGRARRMQVATPELQHQVMIEAVENHMPEVIVIDEIGTELEALAARTIAERGVQLVGTAHGNYLESVIKNPVLSDLIGGIQYVTLGDDEAKRRGSQKSILERKAVPAFQAAVEIHERNHWTIHEKTDQVVDQILQGSRLYIQKRRLNDDGSISIICENSNSKEFIINGNLSNKQKNAKLKPPQNKLLTHIKMSSANPLVIKDFYSFEKIPQKDIDANFNYSLPKYLNNEKEPIYLYSYGINIQQIESVINTLNFAIILTRNIVRANFILALKNYIKHNNKIRLIAKSRQITVYTISSGTGNNIKRALKQIVNLYKFYPSDWSKLSFGNNIDQIKAIFEVRLAIEKVIIPKKQSVQLLPQSIKLKKLQYEIVNFFNLKCNYYGKEYNQGLIIYPY